MITRHAHSEGRDTVILPQKGETRSICRSWTESSSEQLAQETIAVVLAGGRGTRLGPLTQYECKPALPFGGVYRNIDFSLSNCVNSGILRIGVATQYKDASLLRHMARVWPDSSHSNAAVVRPWRAERRAGGGRYRGTADAVHQNWPRIEAKQARLVLILAGDHIYKMDYRPMLTQHVACGADVTVGCVEVPIECASDFGVMSIDASNRIIRFSEKPRLPESVPGRPTRALGSMGIYVFNRDFLGKLLRADSLAENSSHDFGRDLLPQLIDKARVFAYQFTANAAIGGGYWRDVGTIPAYWRAHMELLVGVSGFSLDNTNWPVRSDEHSLCATRRRTRNIAQSLSAADSILAHDCVMDRAFVRRSVLFANVTVAEHSRVSNAVVLPRARIGRNCLVQNVVVPSGVQIPDGTVINPSRHDNGNDAPTLVTAETCGAENLTAQVRHRRYDHVKKTVSGRQ